MYVMSSEPIPDKTPKDIKLYFADKRTEQDLADAYALVNNKYWWVEDNVYDYEKDTPEYEIACTIAKEWGALLDLYELQVFDILTSEGIQIPETGRREVVAPFMKRNGYLDGNGWWIKEE